MKQIIFKYGGMVLVILIAFLLRSWDLELRPMHGDEAINAFKLADLLTENHYSYNPNEYHGPTLYYFSLPFLFISGINNIIGFSAEILRFVPLVFGIGLILLLFVFNRSFTGNHVWFSGLLVAVSPAFVFYSRYFIHEMLLVFFTYAFIFSFAGFFFRQTRVRAASVGLFLGLMIATKETWIIILAAFVLTFLVLYFFKLISGDYFQDLRKQKTHWLWMLSLSVIIILLFYSSFFSDLNGLIKFSDSFSVYFNRGINSADHDYPWYKYLEWLLFYKSGGTFFTEVFILIFAITGIFAVFSKPVQEQSGIFGKIISIFSVLTLLLFSLIPYKTPWNMLVSWFGFIILSGYGLEFYLQKLSKNIHIVFWIVFSAALLHLTWQGMRINFIDYDRAANPYAYAQPVREITQLVETVHFIAEKNKELSGFRTDVIAPGNDYWPLPWYFRDLQNVGWYDHADTLQASAPLIISSTSLKDDVLYKIYQVPPPGERLMYIPFQESAFPMRNGVNFDVLMQKAVWDNLK